MKFFVSGISIRTVPLGGIVEHDIELDISVILPYNSIVFRYENGYQYANKKEFLFFCWFKEERWSTELDSLFNTEDFFDDELFDSKYHKSFIKM